MIKARRGTLGVPEYEPFFAYHLPPVPDLLQRLSWEHRQIEKLWKDLQRLHRHDGLSHEARLGHDTQAGVGQRLVQVLAEHEATEVAALHPAASKVMTSEWADAATAEHAELRAMLDEVDGCDPADEAAFEIFQHVMAWVMAHISEEEQIVFPAMRVASPAEDLVNPEGYDFLGLPPGQTMIQATPGQRPRALGTGRSPGVGQMALASGPNPAQAETEPRPAPKARSKSRTQAQAKAPPAAAMEPEPEASSEADSNGHGEPGGKHGETEIDLRDRAKVDAAANGGTGDEATGTTKTRVKRLLRRR